MYYHFIPKYFADDPDRDCFLKSFEIPELGLQLTDKELKTIKPYPNERYSIGCLRHGFRGRNLIGFVIESEKSLSNFTKICEWVVYPLERGEPDIGFVFKHITRYRLLDDDYPLFSDNFMLLNSWSIENKKYPLRRPSSWPEDRRISSVMELNSQLQFDKVEDKLGGKPLDDFYEIDGVISEREQIIDFHTAPIDLYRYLSENPGRKMPPLDKALQLTAF